MTTFFADTSALAKRYIAETGSQWLTSAVESSSGNVTIISAIAAVEVVSLLARRRRDKNLSHRQFTRLQNDFLLHFDDEYLVVEIDDIVLSEARNLTIKHPLRTLDSLQLACALVITARLGESLTFLSADPRLLSAAAAEGFTVDDPNTHP